MPINIIEIVETTKTTPRFVSLTIGQGRNGEVSMNIQYELLVSNQQGETQSSEHVMMALSDAEIRSHPEFQTVYAIIRDICRAAFVRDNPEFHG